MEIHNLMEDKVIAILNEICDEEELTNNCGYCTSPECRIDAECFVLNRIPQCYVSSGRGFAHMENTFYDDHQIHIDIVALTHEGLRRVTSIQRNFYNNANSESEKIDEGLYFQFPIIKGRLFNSANFAPITGIDISFRHEGEEVPMVDTRWQNPYSIVHNTPGMYLFLPKPIEGKKENEEKDFVFELIVHDDMYEPFVHSFTIAVHAKKINPAEGMKSMRDYNLQDLFLIPFEEEIR